MAREELLGLASFLGSATETYGKRREAELARQHARSMVTHQIGAQEQAMKDRYGEGGLFGLQTTALGERSAAEWGGGDIDPTTGLPTGGFRLNELKAKGLMGDFVAGMKYRDPLGSFYKGEEALADVLKPGGPRARQAEGRAAIQKKFPTGRGRGPSTKPFDPVRNPEWAEWLNNEAQDYIGGAAAADSPADYQSLRKKITQDQRIPEHERNKILGMMAGARANTLTERALSTGRMALPPGLIPPPSR